MRRQIPRRHRATLAQLSVPVGVKLQQECVGLSYAERERTPVTLKLRVPPVT